MKNLRIILCIFVCSIFIQGCINQGKILFESANIENNKGDYPYAWVVEETDTAYVNRRTKIKGEIAEHSIAPMGSILSADIFSGIKKQCGYEPSQRIQIRKLSYESDIFKEIWVFKDDKSEMQDKTTALTVIMENNRKIGGVDIATLGECPAKIMSIYTNK